MQSVTILYLRETSRYPETALRLVIGMEANQANTRTWIGPCVGRARLFLVEEENNECNYRITGL